MPALNLYYFYSDTLQKEYVVLSRLSKEEAVKEFGEGLTLKGHATVQETDLAGMWSIDQLPLDTMLTPEV